MNRDASEDRERIYLALLCQRLLGESVRAEFQALLVRHSWQSHDHRAVFEALAGWQAGPDAIHADLPSRLTRLGFPDTDIDRYFAPVEVPAETAFAWLRAEVACHSSRESEPNRIASESRAAKSK